LDGHVVEAFVANACLSSFSVPHKQSERFVLVSNFDIRISAMKSGWWDLNPRPVAAATALRYFVELLPTSTGFVISLALRCFRTGGKAFTAD
jgi:hypothetical protein